ncbi:nucleoside hydrolase [Oceanivirga salmonicida]|uniref:nucleoside hydrolase n=1 Tax=Oceanivirga salmonicida TaxID=1769291 RepID=UPI0012E261E4|nr:nucleoside hydrolase [Oceanivirga salmonicida]
MKKVPIILDTDPGIDDAIALGLALNCENIDIKLITTVAGNVNITHTTRNALDLLSFYEREDIPVAKGTSKPLIIPYEDASEYHGINGLGDIEIPKSDVNVLENAVYEMRKLILNSKEKITIIAIGPLTNIALLISTFPEVKNNIQEIILMGGALGRGNKEPLIEYNIGADPHAAKIVFNSKLKITMLGLEMGNNAKIDQEDIKHINNKVSNFFYNLLTKYRGAKDNTVSAIYDATAIAYLNNPNIFDVEYLFVDVEINGLYTNGTTIIDLRKIYNKESNVYVATKIDSKAFKKWVIDNLKSNKL